MTKEAKEGIRVLLSAATLSIGVVMMATGLIMVLKPGYSIFLTGLVVFIVSIALILKSTK